MNNKVFPTILIILNLSASVVFFTKGDWRMGVYWIAAATLNTVITY